MHENVNIDQNSKQKLRSTGWLELQIKLRLLEGANLIASPIWQTLQRL